MVDLVGLRESVTPCVTAGWVWTGLLSQVFTLGASLAAERGLAPWLPWFRRYLSTWLFGAGLVVTLWTRTTWANIPVLVLGVAALYWNLVTGIRNMRNGRRGKPRPSLGAALTTVQAACFRREVTA